MPEPAPTKQADENSNSYKISQLKRDILGYKEEEHQIDAMIQKLKSDTEDFYDYYQSYVIDARRNAPTRSWDSCSCRHV